MTDQDLIGGNTTDLLALRETHPAERTLPHDAREERTRTWGRRFLITGLSLLVVDYLSCLGTAYAAEGQLFHEGAAQLFGMLCFVTAALTGSALTFAGCMERVQRSQRAMLRRILTIGEGNAERIDYMTGAVAPLPGIVSQMHEVVSTVPDYSQGLADGARIIGGSSPLPREGR